MVRKKFHRALLILSLLGVSFLLLPLQGFYAAAVLPPMAEVEHQLLNISEEELALLETLFTLTQEIQGLESQEGVIQEQIELLKEQILQAQASIEENQGAFQQLQEKLEGVLKSYQRRGAASYLEILLKAEDLSDFLRRINLIRDLTRNTGALLKELESQQALLTAKEQELQGTMERLTQEEAQLAKARLEKEAMKASLEEQLAAMAAERDYYEEQLNRLQGEWTALKPLFTETMKTVNQMIEKGALPQEGVKMSLSLQGIKGTIPQEVFNQVVASVQDLPEILFSFQPQQVTITLPQQHLILEGKFSVIDGSILQFTPTGGSFYQLPLTTSALEELFSGESLSMNTKPLLGNYRLKSAIVVEGALELLVSFF